MVILDSGNAESVMALTDGLEGGFWCVRKGIERFFYSVLEIKGVLGASAG